MKWLKSLFSKDMLPLSEEDAPKGVITAKGTMSYEDFAKKELTEYHQHGTVSDLMAVIGLGGKPSRDWSESALNTVNPVTLLSAIDSAIPVLIAVDEIAQFDVGIDVVNTTLYVPVDVLVTDATLKLAGTTQGPLVVVSSTLPQLSVPVPPTGGNELIE